MSTADQPRPTPQPQTAHPPTPRSDPLPVDHPFVHATSWIYRDLHNQLDNIIHAMLFSTGDEQAPAHPVRIGIGKLHKMIAVASHALYADDPIGELEAAWGANIPPLRRSGR